MTPDHPHAKVLANVYDAMSAVMHDSSLGPEQREAGFKDVAQQLQQLLAPDFVIHTGGIRLAATGDRAFTMVMGQRRNAISGGTFRPMSKLSFAADDVYATIRGRFGAQPGGRSYEWDGMGLWRFDEEGQATEHWELGPGRLWDEVFISCDPDFEFSTGEEFWMKDVATPAS